MPPHSSLARLFQAVLPLQLAAAASWFAVLWPKHPAWAACGAVAILLIAPISFAVQFALLRQVARSDTAPVPRLAELVRAWIGEVSLLPRIFFWRIPLRWRHPPDHLESSTRGRPGVVLIHGFICNRGFWGPWLQTLRQRNHAYVAVNLEPVFGSIDAYVETIDAAVRQVAEATGQPPMLVCHSMGGLAARAWLRATRHAGHEVRRVVTIGTPHRGTWLARWSHGVNGRQMRRGSDWLVRLAQDEALAGQPAFTCWYSHCDNIVFPTSTATLDSADNRLVRGPAHVDLAFHPAVMEGTLRLLEEPPKAF